MANLDYVKFYAKHRQDYARLLDHLVLLDDIYTRPLSKENIDEFVKAFKSFDSKIEFLLFNHINCI